MLAEDEEIRGFIRAHLWTRLAYSNLTQIQIMSWSIFEGRYE